MLVGVVVGGVASGGGVIKIQQGGGVLRNAVPRC